MDRDLRMNLGNNLREYLDNCVSWEIVAKQYIEAYDLARKAKSTGEPVVLDSEF